MSYYRSFNLPITILRPFNCFGPRQSLRAVIPTIISQALFKKQIDIGNTHTSRDYTYVEDLAEAYFHVLKNKIFFGPQIPLAKITPQLVVISQIILRGQEQ